MNRFRYLRFGKTLRTGRNAPSRRGLAVTVRALHRIWIFEARPGGQRIWRRSPAAAPGSAPTHAFERNGMPQGRGGVSCLRARWLGRRTDRRGLGGGCAIGRGFASGSSNHRGAWLDRAVPAGNHSGRLGKRYQLRSRVGLSGGRCEKVIGQRKGHRRQRAASLRSSFVIRGRPAGRLSLTWNTGHHS
jgi:hypothetical protein